MREIDESAQVDGATHFQCYRYLIFPLVRPILVWRNVNPAPIRTMAISGGILTVQAGAGIVADSSPEGEYEETMKKAAAMFKALEQATQRG